MLIAGTFMTVSAEERVRPMPINAPTQAVRAIKAVLATSTRPAMMLEDGVPLTGDKTVDDKIKALVKARNEKLKAVHDAFQAELKTLIGERKLLQASTTPAKRFEMQDRMMNASGTPVRPPVATGTPMRLEDKRAPLKQEPNKNLFKRFIQSLLGGNPQELQAEEIR